VFGIIVITTVLEWLILMPASFTVLRFFLPPSFALLLSCLLCLISILACWLCELKLKTYVYRIISIAVSILLALICAQVSVGAVLIAIISLFIFRRVKSNIPLGKDIAAYIPTIAITLNIVLALINVYTTDRTLAGFSNATIFVSTIAAIISLILTQVDNSRTFGKNDMDISTTQRNNNRIFAGIVVALLLVVSSIGQVSNIYKLILNVFVRFLKIVAYIFAPSTTKVNQSAGQIKDIFGMGEAKEPSILDMIIHTLISVLAVVVIVASVVYLSYTIFKIVKNLIIRIISWLKNVEQADLRFFENGHVDEKQSLLNRNLSNMARKFRNVVEGVFDREIPYNKLPNGIAKTRRLFKHFETTAQQAGVQISNSSTAEEICQQVSGKTPKTKQFDDLVSRCYDAARYGEVAPTLEELLELENKLLR